MLLRLRTRTVRGIRTDFGDMFLNKSCPLAGCQSTLDSLSHVLVCPMLVKNGSNKSYKYNDVFSQDVTELKHITTEYTRLLQLRDKLLSEGTPDVDTPGLLH